MVVILASRLGLHYLVRIRQASRRLFGNEPTSIFHGAHSVFFPQVLVPWAKAEPLPSRGSPSNFVGGLRSTPWVLESPWVMSTVPAKSGAPLPLWLRPRGGVAKYARRLARTVPLCGLENRV